MEAMHSGLLSQVTAQQRLRALHSAVGDTPLFEVRCRYKGRPRSIFAKYESANLTGSIKDRMALCMLEEALLAGVLQPGATIVEASSGNTGIAFAAIGRMLGHPVRIYMPDWMSQERTSLIASFGAEIVPVSAAMGGFLGSVRLADEYAVAHPGSFRPKQFDSPANARAHARTTAVEILAQLGREGLAPTGFVAGVGTGGTVMGVHACFAERVPSARVHPLEPANSPTLRTGHKVGKHRIQGISDEFVPALVDLDRLAPIVDVWDGDAIRMAQRLACELGLAVGISSGANFLGALMVAEEQGADAVVTTVFPDSNKKYLSTDLCRAEPPREDYASDHVELIESRALPRCGFASAQ